MKRLLIFHPALAPYRVDLFNLLAHNFDIELVLFDTNLVNQKFDQKKLVSQLNCKVSYLTSGFRWKDRYFRTGAIRKIIKSKPDVVLLAEFSPVAIAVVLYKLLFHPRFQLYTMTDDTARQFCARKGLKKYVLRLFVKVLDGVIVANKETQQCYETITPKNSNKIYVTVPIVHALNVIREEESIVLSRAADLRNDFAKDGKKVVLFVGRLDPVKNLSWLIKTWSMKDCKAILVIVGDGELRRELQRQIAELGLENQVLMVGRKEGREVYEMMAMADALVLPSQSETFGAVVGEALQWGTPCLVSDHVGAKSLIKNDEQGAVFKLNSEVDFVEKLHRVLGLNVNHSLSLMNDALDEPVAEFAKKVYDHA